VSSVTEKPGIIIRDIELISEMQEVESLQQEVWACDERDIVPLTILVATRELGAILIGAFDGQSLIGFAYSFVGCEDGRIVHHSHMLAVRPRYRNVNLGYKLKLAQRDRALAQGITRMTWTFDPLQSLNAHFNFAKLGVVADAYKINFYGEATSSFLHQIGNGTDRLWVTWPLDSRRVQERIQTKRQSRSSNLEPDRVACLIQVGPNNVPQRGHSSQVIGQKYTSVEIPADINTLQRESPELAGQWREATRWAFSEATASGYIIKDFWAASRNDEAVGVYLLSYGKKLKDFV
jgi:predicted GNAT superfamily acetyltransferase